MEWNQSPEYQKQLETRKEANFDLFRIIAIQARLDAEWKETNRHRADEAKKQFTTSRKGIKNQLTDDEVREIRRSNLGTYKLAVIYHRSRSLIQSIRIGRYYKHVI